MRPISTWPASIGGALTDNHGDDTIWAVCDTMQEHTHGVGKVYPSGAAGVQLTAGVGWAQGGLEEIVPVSTITSIFDIHHVIIEAADTNAVYEIVLYYGAGDTECCRIRFSKQNNNELQGSIPAMTPLIPANSRIRASCASSTNGAKPTISLFYHTY